MTWEILTAKGGTLGEKFFRWFCTKFRLPPKFRDVLHAANLRHGTDGFTSPPKEGVLRIFFALKIRRLRPCLNPRTWVLKASTLPLDHRSHSDCYTVTLYTRTTSKFTTTILFSELCTTPSNYTQISNFVFVKSVIRALELTLPFTQWLKGAFWKDLKRPGCQAGHRFLFIAKNRNEWRYFCMCLHVLPVDNPCLLLCTKISPTVVVKCRIHRLLPSAS